MSLSRCFILCRRLEAVVGMEKIVPTSCLKRLLINATVSMTCLLMQYHDLAIAIDMHVCLGLISNSLFATRYSQCVWNISNVFCFKVNALQIFKTLCEYSKRVANVSEALQLFKKVIVSNALLLFKTRCYCFKRVANYQKHLKYFKRLANIQNTLLTFQPCC